MCFNRRSASRVGLLFAVLLSTACRDDPVQVIPSEPEPTIVDSVRVTASVRWNQRAIALVVARPPAANAQAHVSCVLTYLSVAQVRAAGEAKTKQNQSRPPSLSAGWCVGRRPEQFLPAGRRGKRGPAQRGPFGPQVARKQQG
jgi:hypothetical protein